MSVSRARCSTAPCRNELYDHGQAAYDPWGRGGAGAPIRDRAGNLVADRGLLRQSWHRVLDSNAPHSLRSAGDSSVDANFDPSG